MSGRVGPFIKISRNNTVYGVYIYADMTEHSCRCICTVFAVRMRMSTCKSGENLECSTGKEVEIVESCDEKREGLPRKEGDENRSAREAEGRKGKEKMDGHCRSRPWEETAGEEAYDRSTWRHSTLTEHKNRTEMKRKKKTVRKTKIDR